MEAAIITGAATIIVAVIGLISAIIANRKKTEEIVKAVVKEEVGRGNAETNKRINDLEKSIDANEKDRIRYEMFAFANSCRKKERHTKDEFDHIITLKAKYDILLKRTGDSNGVFDLEYEFIREIYATCQRENSFL